MSASADKVVHKLDQILNVSKMMEKHLSVLSKGDKRNSSDATESSDKPSEKKTGFSADDVSNLTKISSALAETIKAINDSGEIDPDKGKDVAKFITNFSEGLNDVVKNLDEKKLESYTSFLDVVISGAGKFMKDMALVAIISPLSMLGAAGFSLTLLITTKILSYASAVDATITSGIESVMKIGKGAFLFGLSLAGFLLISPLAAAGALAFFTILTGLSAALGIAMFMAGKNEEGPLYKLKEIAIGLAVFSLVLVGYSFAGPILAKGALNFVLILMGISIGVGIATKIAGKTPEGGSPLTDLLKLGWSLVKFGVALALFAVASPLIIIGTLVFVASLLGIAFALNKTAKMLEGSDKKSPIFKLAEIGKGILWFGLALALTGLASPLIAVGALVMTLSIMGIGWALSKYMSDDSVAKGIKNFKDVGKTILMFSLAAIVLSFVSISKWMNVGVGIIAIATLITVIGGAAYLLGVLDKSGQVTKGMNLLEQMNKSLLIIAGATGVIYVLSKIAPSDYVNVGLGVAAVAAAITILGLAAYIIGQPAVAPFVGIGAGVLLTLSASLFIFAQSLKTLSEIQITPDKAKNIGESILEIGKGIASLGIRPGVFLGSMLLLPMGAGIFALSFGIKKFQDIGYKYSTGDLMQDAVTKTVTTFTDAFKNLTFKDWIKINAGIQMVGGIGNAISKLAEGVGKMANLEVVEYEVKKGELVPKSTRKLSQKDFEKAANNVLAILGFGTANGRLEGGDSTDAIVKSGMMGALRSVGELMSGDGNRTSGFFGLFSKSYIERGIDGVAKIGKMLATLGSGVADMASLQVRPMELFGAGTADAKLIPGSPITLNESHFINAAANVMRILGFEPGAQLPDSPENGASSGIMGVLTAFGKAMDEGDNWGWFSTGYLEKGIEGLSKISNVLGTLAQGVLSMASLQFHPLELVNGGTADAKLVPGSPVTLNETHFKTAANNVGKILTPLIKPLSTFGKAMAGDLKKSELKELFGPAGADFDPGYVEDGLEAIGMLTKNIGSIADMIIKLGGDQIQLQEIYTDPKTGMSTLVPGKMLNMGDAANLAAYTLRKILTAVPSEFSRFGISWSNYLEKPVNTGIEAFSVVNKGMETLSDIIHKFAEISENYANTKEMQIEPELLIMSFSSSLSNLGETFKTKFNAPRIAQFSQFNKEMSRLALIATPFDKFVKSFGEMAKHMGVFTTNFKVMDAQGILAFKDWTGSMVEISKVDISKSDGIINFINDAVSAAFSGGGSKDVSANKSPQDYSESDKRKQVESQNNKGKSVESTGNIAEEPVKQQIIKIDEAQLAAAISTALRNITVETIKAKKIETF